MTGGAGAGSITDQAMYSSFSAWPPASLGTTPVNVLPTYTQTGSIITAPPAAQPTSFPSGYSSSANVGDGWIQPSDTAGFYTPVAGCSYPDAWSGVQASSKSLISISTFCHRTELTGKDLISQSLLPLALVQPTR